MSQTNYVMIQGASSRAKTDAKNVIADAGGYTLLKGPGVEANFGGPFVYLTQEEASWSALSHLFTDYTNMAVEDRIEKSHPMIVKDEEILQRIRQDAVGYFYCRNQSPLERAESLTRYGNALSMATAGSVEGTLEALSIVVPADADEVAFVAVIASRLMAHVLKYPR
tara:strand:- start:70 stop:570 length:501 start_codon:yes stop_codon:yes gene_type:complete